VNRGDEPSWDIAVCDRASLREAEEIRGRPGEPHELIKQVALVISQSEARALRARLGPAALDWSTFAGPERERDETREVRRALTLVQLLEAFTKALDALPVEVCEPSSAWTWRAVGSAHWLGGLHRQYARMAYSLGTGEHPAQRRRGDLSDADSRTSSSSMTCATGSTFTVCGPAFRTSTTTLTRANSTKV
jgi:hypothetical protein